MHLSTKNSSKHRAGITLQSVVALPTPSAGAKIEWNGVCRRWEALLLLNSYANIENPGWTKERLRQQPDNPVTLTHVAKILRRKTAAPWEASSGFNDDRIQKFNEDRRAGDYKEVLDHCDAVQLFCVRAGTLTAAFQHV
ncbi:hypothetical protein PoB_003964500 [Plakobranchus ocellatus]|uniref:Uncharacterized protein n=1 Tax=Plakobranchus ocellatus TaxID=259542 RepID=A0AAV4B232_9GAST|nr:hypothetical protein PoB_003964500 [Plakobranchus ocellatus]